MAGNVVFHQQGLEDIGDAVGQSAGSGQLSIEKRNTFVHFLQQILIGKPDKINKVGGDKLIGVGDLKRQLSAGRGIGVSKGYVGECPAFAQIRAALWKSSSPAVVPTGSPLAAAISSWVKRLLPVAFTSMSL